MFGCIVPTGNRDREEDLYQDLLSLWDLYGNSIALTIRSLDPIRSVDPCSVTIRAGRN